MMTDFAPKSQPLAELKVLRGHLYDFREISGNGLAARVAFEFELRDSKTGNTVWTRY